MADDYVTVRAQRSRFFGPDATYAQRGNGTTPNNLNIDFFFQRAINTHVVEKLIAEPPPHGPLPVVKQTVRGYVKGYNRFLKDTGVAHISDPSCRGKSWVRPITELDAYRRFWQLGLLASQGVALDGIGGAQPPPLGPFAQPSQAQLRTFGARLFDLGIGALQADLCVRIADPDVVGKLRPLCGRALLEAGNPAMGVILAANPPREAPVAGPGGRQLG